MVWVTAEDPRAQGTQIFIMGNECPHSLALEEDVIFLTHPSALKGDTIAVFQSFVRERDILVKIV